MTLVGGAGRQAREYAEIFDIPFACSSNDGFLACYKVVRTGLLSHCLHAAYLE